MKDKNIYIIFRSHASPSRRALSTLSTSILQSPPSTSLSSSSTNSENNLSNSIEHKTINNKTSVQPTIFCINATSLAKTHAVQLLETEIKAQNANIAVVIETWFTCKHMDSELSILGYSLYRSDIGMRKGEGICSYVQQYGMCDNIKCNINCTIINVPLPRDNEVCSVEIMCFVT